MPQLRHETATPPQAILLILLTGLLFACMDTGAKFLVVSGMASPFVAWMRFVVHTVFVLLALRAWNNAAIFRFQSLPMQLVRGMALVGSTIFNFAALRTLQLAETTSFYFFAPMVITALAGPLLGEWAGWRRWIAILVGFVGVLVIARPGFGTFEIGHVLALCSTASYCFYVILTRQMSQRETPESLIFYSALAPVILMAPIVPFTASAPPSPVGWAVMLGLGLFGGIGHWYLIKAYSLASTTALAPYPYMQMVWMIALGYVVFCQLPDGWTLGGAAIIVMSGLYIVHRERQLRLQSRTVPNSEAADLTGKP